MASIFKRLISGDTQVYKVMSTVELMSTEGHQRWYLDELAKNAQPTSLISIGTTPPEKNMFEPPLRPQCVHIGAVLFPSLSVHLKRVW